MTVAEANALCRARKLGPSACADLVAPLCGPTENVAFDLDGARCVAESDVSPRKAAAILAESHAGGPPPPWLLIGAGVAVVALGAWLVLRS